MNELPDTKSSFLFYQSYCLPGYPSRVITLWCSFPNISSANRVDDLDALLWDGERGAPEVGDASDYSVEIYFWVKKNKW